MGTRRAFLFECSAAAAAAAFIPSSLFGSAPGATAEIGLAGFAAQLNTGFLVKSETGTPVKVELINATPSRLSQASSVPAPDAHHEKFSLLFSGPKEPALSQDTYGFEHPKLGRFLMFIARVGRPDQEHCYYEAIFSRPTAHKPELL